jgi:O-acetylhomoserine (thiol)-lyase
MSESWGFETKQVHAGTSPDPTTGARAVPIYQTTSYVFRDTAHAAALFGLEELGFIYTRIMNPTQAAFEDRVAALEGGVGALAVASGQAAQFEGLMNLAENGGHIVSSASLYGGTYNQLHYTFPKLGVEVSFIDDPDDLDAWRAAIRPNTKALYGESIGNPKGDIFDFEGVSALGHDVGIPLVIDNTLASPYLCQPLRWGADIVVHSATKFIGGHGNSIGGVIAESGIFDYSGFPTIADPSPAYHGLKFFETFGHYGFLMKARAETVRDTGACLSPMNAFLLLQGVETLSLRMERHVRNTRAVAEFLHGHPAVAWVSWAGLADHPDHGLALKYLQGTPGAVFSFGIKANASEVRDAGRRFIEALQLFSHLANVGDARSLVIHPASTTHQQLSDAELAAAGVGPELIRLSVGLETVEDLLWDLDQALRAISR